MYSNVNKFDNHKIIKVTNSTATHTHARTHARSHKYTRTHTSMHTNAHTHTRKHTQTRTYTYALRTKSYKYSKWLSIIWVKNGLT